jgi:DeoR family transcriptional regulator, suf operon transcriptional repressor
VRHHLTNMQADGFVAAEEERHGVGRPRLVYFLTEKGLERFPTRYFRLTTRLLNKVKETLPGPVVDRLFTQMAEELAAGYAEQVQSMHIEQKLDTIKELLIQEGFSVEWEKDGDRYLIHEITCPYYHVGQNHPEVCTVDQTLISTVLAIPVEKINCILSGDRHCTYEISSKYFAEERK